MNKKSYPFILKINGVSERIEVEAESVTEAVFLMGVEIGQQYPNLIPNATVFKIIKQWGNP